MNSVRRFETHSDEETRELGRKLARTIPENGVVLLIGAADIGRRRFAGRLGAQHGYEAPLALGSALAGLASAGLTLSIGILMGEGLPTVAVGRAFSSAIPIELLIVPLGVAITWLELGRLVALRRSLRRTPTIPARLVQRPQGA